MKLPVRAILVASAALLALPACNRAEIDAWLAKCDTADATLAEANASWKTAALSFMDRPVATSGPCEITDVHGGPESLSLYDRTIVEREGSRLGEITDMVSQANVARTGLERDGRLPNAAMSAAIDRAAAADDWGYDWLLLTTSSTEPEVLEGNTFRTGTATGWLMIWGYAEGRFLCAGAFDAENSDEVGGEQAGDAAALRWNLTAEAFEMGQSALQALPEG